MDRPVLKDLEILRLECRKCHASEGYACKSKEGHSLTHDFSLNGPVMKFHRERMLDAWASHSSYRMGNLNATDKALITYYAFIMLADAVSVKAVEMLGKPFTSEDIQTFFAYKAVEELRKDKLLD